MSTTPTATPSPVKAQFQAVFDALQGAQTVQVLSLGLRLGLFVTLHDAGALTDIELADTLQLHAPYIQVWCQTAYAFGMLELRDDGRYRLPDGLATVLLDADHSRYLGGFVNGFGGPFADDFARAPQAFVDGQVFPFWQRGEGFSAWVSALTHPMQRLVVGRLLPDLFPNLVSAPTTVLDVGCGTGQLLFKLLAAYPQWEAVGIDADPHGIKLALGDMVERGLEGRVTFEYVRGEDLRLADTFDLAVMFEVLHEIPFAARPDVLAAAFRALKPGGRLLIVDETWPDDPRQLRDPAYRFSVLVQFTEVLWGNLVATETEQNQLLADAGFVQVQRGDLGGVFTTLVATKP